MKFSDLVLVTDYNHGMISFKNGILFLNFFFCLNAQLLHQT